MKTIATQVREAIHGAAAVTFYGGYAVMPDNSIVHFPQGTSSNERRNQKGRCINLLLTYSDGSKLQFKYSENKGASYKVS